MTTGGDCLCQLCVDYGNRADYAEHDRRLIDGVQRNGHQCLGIIPTKPTDSPSYAFTIGLWHSRRQPELAIYGVNDVDQMINALNVISSRADTLRPNSRFSEVLGLRGVDPVDYWVKLMPIHPSWYRSQFGTARWFNAANTVDFLQAVWPDASGRYPGDPDFDEYFADRQPMMWLPLADHPPSIWVDDTMRSMDDTTFNTGLRIPRVGTWGTEPFDNDHASDWSAEFEELDPADRLGFLERTFSNVYGHDYLDMRFCEEAVAAAAAVAALLPDGPPLANSMAPQSLSTEPGFTPNTDLRTRAAAAVRAVAQPESEWSQLWAESDDSAARWELTQLLNVLQPYDDWSQHRNVRDAATAYLQDPDDALGALADVVDLDSVDAFTLHREINHRDWGRPLYQEIAATDGTRLLLWMGDDIRTDEDDPQPGTVVFQSSLRVLPLSWVYDVSLEENHQTVGGRRVLGSVEVRVFIGIADSAKRRRGTKKTDIYAEELRFAKSLSDSSPGQLARLVEFGRALTRHLR